PDPADTAHRALAAQRHGPSFGERIDARAIERQEAVRLPLPEPRSELRRGLVVASEDGPFEQRFGHRGESVAALGGDWRPVFPGKARPAERQSLVERAWLR